MYRPEPEPDKAQRQANLLLVFVVGVLIGASVIAVVALASQCETNDRSSRVVNTTREVTRMVEVLVEIRHEVVVTQEVEVPVEVVREVEVIRNVEVPVEVVREIEVIKNVEVPVEVVSEIVVTRDVEVPVEVTREVEVTRVVVATPTPTATPHPPSTAAKLVESVKPGIARITANRHRGSGVIFHKEETTAFVATNHHIIENADAINVEMFNGQEYKGTLLGWDAERDVAVLSICCSWDYVVLPWLPVEAAIGSDVVAVGYSESNGGLTATTGSVLDADDVSKQRGFIIHSAPLNPGNSGGPLVALSDTKVLGINTARGTQKLAFYAVPYQIVEKQVQDWRSKLVILPAPTPTPAITFETVEGVDFSYTLHEIRDPVEPRFGVEAGHRLVAIDVTLETLHDNTVIHPWYFGLQDTDGYVYKPDWVDQVMEPELHYDYGNLPLNQKVRGWITLEVPQSAVLTAVFSFESRSGRSVMIAELTRD